MSHDTRLQQAKRSGDATELLKARLHSGELSGERLRVAAHSKDYAAKEVVGSPCCCRVWPCRDDCTDRQAGMNLADWATGLLSLAAACARVVLSVPCSMCEGLTYPGTVNSCPMCSGSRRVPKEIPAEQHLAVTVGVAVARAVPLRDHRPVATSDRCPVCEAIEAVGRWLVEPSEVNRVAWDRATHGPRGRELFGWVVSPRDMTSVSFEERLDSAATLLGEQRVREIAARAGREWAMA